MPDNPWEQLEREMRQRANTYGPDSIAGPMWAEAADAIRETREAMEAEGAGSIERLRDGIEQAKASLDAALHKGSLRVRTEVAERLVRNARNSLVLALRDSDPATPSEDEGERPDRCPTCGSKRRDEYGDVGQFPTCSDEWHGEYAWAKRSLPDNRPDPQPEQERSESNAAWTEGAKRPDPILTAQPEQETCDGSGLIVRPYMSHHEPCPGCPKCQPPTDQPEGEWLRLLAGSEFVPEAPKAPSGYPFTAVPKTVALGVVRQAADRLRAVEKELKRVKFDRDCLRERANTHRAHARTESERAEEAVGALREIDHQVEYRVGHERSQGEENCPHCTIRAVVRDTLTRLRSSEGSE